MRRSDYKRIIEILCAKQALIECYEPSPRYPGETRGDWRERDLGRQRISQDPPRVVVDADMGCFWIEIESGRAIEISRQVVLSILERYGRRSPDRDEFIWRTIIGANKEIP